MSARPVTIPVCRLFRGLPGIYSTHHRRAAHGDYGAVTRDECGGKSVALEAVENFLGIKISDEQVAIMLALPSTHGKCEARKNEIARVLNPGPIEPELSAVFLAWVSGTVRQPPTLADINDLILSNVKRRDISWRRLIAAQRKP